MKLTLGQAAKECGKSKATLSKAIKSGRLSVVSKSTAGFEIDPAELFRVFPIERSQANDANNRKPLDETGVNAAEIAVLQAQNEALEAQIAMLREMVDKADANADEWRKQAQTLALTDTRPKVRQGGVFGLFRRDRA